MRLLKTGEVLEATGISHQVLYRYATLGLIEEAANHYRAGFEWCEQEGWPVEAGRCLQGLAEVAEIFKGGDKPSSQQAAEVILQLVADKNGAD